MNKAGQSSNKPFIQPPNVPHASVEQGRHNSPQSMGPPNLGYGYGPNSNTPQSDVRTYQPALTDGGWPNTTAPNAQPKETRGTPNDSISQETLLEWFAMITDVAMKTANASVKQIGNVAYDIGTNINMADLFGKPPENPRKPNDAKITDDNVLEFIATGTIEQNEAKNQQIAIVRERLEALKARASVAQQQEDCHGKPVVRAVLADEQAANELGGPKKFRIAKKVGPYHLAIYRKALKKAREQRERNQQGLQVPQGRESSPSLLRIGKKRPKQQSILPKLMGETGIGQSGTIDIGQ